MDTALTYLIRHSGSFGFLKNRKNFHDSQDQYRGYGNPDRTINFFFIKNGRIPGITFHCPDIKNIPRAIRISPASIKI